VVDRFAPFFVSFFESSASPSGRIHSLFAIPSSARICSARSPFGCFFTSATMREQVIVEIELDDDEADDPS
jgi:hypothetical protein